MDSFSTGASGLDSYADMKVKQFPAEAKNLNAREMARIKAAKPYALAVSFIAVKKGCSIGRFGGNVRTAGQ